MLSHSEYRIPHKLHGLTLKKDERVSLALRGLYESYGFSKFAMSKFEPYDLYSHHKDFLVSENCITFNDTDGSLLALKPDVTLSIVKNTKDTPESVQKLYYNENVYRVSKKSGTFKEIVQVGLECIGAIDFYSVYEVMELSAKSLLTISDHSVLSISDARIVTRIIDTFDVRSDVKEKLLSTIIEKNTHELKTICSNASISIEQYDALLRLSQMYGGPSDILAELSEISAMFGLDLECSEFMRVALALEEEFVNSPLKIIVDFSSTNDTNYYNAIVFRGYVKGISSAIISGGQYDLLMEKMGRESDAIGFACYLDLLEELGDETPQYDVDTLILYAAEDDFENVSLEARRLRDAGESVMVQKEVPEGLRYRHLIHFETR